MEAHGRAGSGWQDDEEKPKFGSKLAKISNNLCTIWRRARFFGRAIRGLIVLASLVALCCGFKTPDLEMIGKVNGQIGDQIVIKASNLDDGIHRLTLCRGVDDCSWAEYLARGGTIDPSLDAPVGGRYQGIDPAGLIWTSSKGVDVSPQVEKKLAEANFDGISYVGYLEYEDRIIADSELHYGDLVRTSPINESRHIGGVAKIYWPPNPGAYEIVFVFDGQPPNRDNSFMPRLALHGFIVVYVDYWSFSSSDGDACLRGANLDEAFFLIQGIGGIFSSGALDGYSMKGQRVHLLGASRGGEAARWMAIIAPEYVQTLSVLSGAAYAMPSCNPGDHPWVFRGKPLPSLPVDIGRYRDAISYARLTDGGQVAEVEYYLNSLPELDQFWIPVECSVPALFIYGTGDDRIDGRRLPLEYGRRCVSGVGRTLELESGHPLMMTAWDKFDCRSWDNENVSCASHMASIQIMEDELIKFIRANPSDFIENGIEDIGKCRRSSPDLMNNMANCN